MRALITAAVVLALGVLGCSGDGGAPTVQVLDNAFEPAAINITVGTRVNWSWNGRNPHNVIFDQSTGLPSSGVQTEGAFDITFSATGTFNYQCSIHAGMTGTVTVHS